MATDTTPAPRKRGRPKAAKARDAFVTIAVTREEAALLRARAEAAGFVSLGAWVRLQLGLPAVPR